MNRIQTFIVGTGIVVVSFVMLYFFSQPIYLFGLEISPFQQGFFVSMAEIAVIVIGVAASWGTQREDKGEVGDDLSAIPVPTNQGMEEAIRLTQEQHGQGTYNVVTAGASLDDPEQTSLKALFEIAESWGITLTKYRKGKVRKTGDRAWVVNEILKAMQTHNDMVTADSLDSLAESMGDVQEALDFGDARDDVEEDGLPEEGLSEESEGLSEESEPPEFIMIQGKPYRVSEIQESVKATGDGKPIIDLPDEEVAKRLPKQLGDLYMALPAEMQMEIRSIYHLASEHIEIVPLKTLEELESDKYVNARKRRRDYVNKKDKEDRDTEDMKGPPPGARRKGPLKPPDEKKKKEEKEKRKVLRRKTKAKIKPRPKSKNEVTDIE